MKPRDRKFRERDYDRYPGLFPARPATFGREQAIDRAARNDFRLILLRRMLQRHDSLDALIWAIGWIAHNWAVVEQNFEMVITLIYHDLKGKTLVAKRLPFAWNEKVKWVEKAYEKVPELSRYPDGLSLLRRADDLVDRRNDLVHASLTKLRPVERKWLFHIFDYDRVSDQTTHWLVLRHFKFGRDEFLELERKLVPLSGEVAKFGSRLLKDLGP